MDQAITALNRDFHVEKLSNHSGLSGFWVVLEHLSVSHPRLNLKSRQLTTANKALT